MLSDIGGLHLWAIMHNQFETKAGIVGRGARYHALRAMGKPGRDKSHKGGRSVHTLVLLFWEDLDVYLSMYFTHSFRGRRNVLGFRVPSKLSEIERKKPTVCRRTEIQRLDVRRATQIS